MPRILVTDCWTNKSLSVVRSLGEMGFDVHILTHKRLSPPLFSKFAKKSYIFPDPSSKPEEFLEKFLKLIQREKFDSVFPLEEKTISIFLDAFAEIEKYTRIPLASKESFEKANDKWEVLKIAGELGIPQPTSFCPETIEEAMECLKKLSFPVIIKPRISSGSRGLKKIKSKEEFDKVYPEICKKYERPLIQECIDQSGQGLGVGILAKDGKVIADFSYKRLREFPVNGGPSTLRESTDDAVLKNYAALLIKKLNWTGVAMVEFKNDPKDNIPKLMEINPRFWGSLELSHAAGLNFPYLLYRLSANLPIEKPNYKLGVLCRWLIPGDIAHFISNPDRFKLKPSFFQFFDKNTFYDDLSSKDISGSIGVIMCMMLSIFDISIWKMGVFRD